MLGTDRHTRRLRVTRIAALAALLLLGLTGTASAAVSGTGISWGTDPCCGNTPATTVQAGQTQTLYVSFTTPHQLNPGDWITIGGSGLTGLVLPSNGWSGFHYSLVDETASSQSAVLGDINGGGQSVNVPLTGNGSSITVPAGHQVTITISGVTAPTVATPPADSLSVSTSEDMSPVATPGFSVTHASASSIAADSGGLQIAGIGATFAQPFSVRVVDQYGNPVPGEHVTFQAPADGASGTFASSGTGTEAGIVTNAAGVATSSAFTANDTAGGFQVGATDTDGSSIVTSLSLTSLPGAADAVTLVADPATLPADGISSSVLTATVDDAHGNGVAGEDVAFTSSDPLESIGPTVDHGDGTYTATLLAGTSPVPATITATDSSVGPAIHGDAAVTQSALAPSVAARPVNDQGISTATLAGLVNPHGVPTSVHFEYGPSTAYGSSTPAQDAGSGAADRGMSAPLTGLQPGTTYHYRLVATSSAGTTGGRDMTFSTFAVPPPAPAQTSSAPSTTTKTTKPSASRKKKARKRRCRTVRRHGHKVKVCTKAKPKHKAKPRHKAKPKHKKKPKKKGRRA